MRNKITMEMAVILCCYNRIKKTRQCITQLKEQGKNLHSEIQLRFYIYDDGSTDGTAEMLDEQVTSDEGTVIHGKGGLYWCKSMYQVMKLARQDNPDLYLMVNDDVCFYDNALEIMLEDYYSKKPPVGISGATEFNGILTYGGVTKDEQKIEPAIPLQSCYYANWNCFLTDRETVQKIGIIDNHYAHAAGDFDYSFRMHKKHIPIYVAHSFIGECEIDHEELPKYASVEYSRKERFKFLNSPKGLPLYSTLRYARRTKGLKGMFQAFYGWCGTVYYILAGKK